MANLKCCVSLLKDTNISAIITHSISSLIEVFHMLKWAMISTSSSVKTSQGEIKTLKTLSFPNNLLKSTLLRVSQINFRILILKNTINMLGSIRQFEYCEPTYS